MNLFTNCLRGDKRPASFSAGHRYQFRSDRRMVTMHLTVSLLNFVLVAFRVTQCTPTRAKSKVAISCVIPNEVQAGICVPSSDCPAFQRINDIGGLSSVGRISFLRELYCDIDAEQYGVCCPRNSVVSYR